MNHRILLSFAIAGLSYAPLVRAGEPQKWETLPPAVQKTAIANGGTVGMSVDKESELTGGLATYEAGVRAKDGTIHDLVITADGKLVETKTDAAADALAERADRATALLKGVTFSHPRDLTNPYLPLSTLKQDVLEGTDEGKKVRVERTAKPELHKTFVVGAQTIDSLAVEDREFEGGKLSEVALDYFAQDDRGTVYYLGEDVDEYREGKVVGHDGSWLVGKDTPTPGVLFPATPTLGLAWRSEDVSAEIGETDEIVSMSETVVVPAGKYEHAIKVKEVSDGETEFKYYVAGVGVVREVPPDGDEKLASHATNR